MAQPLAVGTAASLCRQGHTRAQDSTCKPADHGDAQAGHSMVWEVGLAQQGLPDAYTSDASRKAESDLMRAAVHPNIHRWVL
jgi:hypothetical protein